MQTETVIRHIVSWLDDYCRTSGMNGFVVGVSGGIDSAVVSTLCARTERAVLAMNMPIYQSSRQETLSDRHIGDLKKRYSNVERVKIDLTKVVQSLEHVLPKGIQDGLTMANMRSRIRMVTLYAFAGHHRMLVVGTGNKVEDFGVGFFTKYGDGGVDISPIGDLYKSEVYELGRTLGVDRDILNVAPTDGLWMDNRTDESQIGASYEELEWAMKVDRHATREENLSDRQKEVLEIYRNFNETNRHKMEPVPVCHIPEAFRR
ncbi:MAG: NAD(+) synthase [Desulfobacterales bacterium]